MQNLYKLLTVLVFLTSAVSGDILYLNRGEEFNGTLKKIKGDTVYFISLSGKQETFLRKEIHSIELEKEKIEKPDSLLKFLYSHSPSKNDFPNAGYMTLYEEENYVIAKDLSYTKETRVIQKILRKRGKTIGTKTIYYLPPNTLDIEWVRVITENGKIIYLKENAMKDESCYPFYPAYDRERRKRFAMRDIKEGSIIDYKLKRKNLPETLPFFITEAFGDVEPILLKRVNISIPEEMQVTIVKSGGIDEECNTREGRKIYSFSIKNTPEIESEPNRPPLMGIVPRLSIGIKGNFRELGDEYLKSIKDSLFYTQEMKGEIRSILFGKEDTLRALYNWVQKEIKYLNINLIEYSYLPKRLNRIFSNRFASNLDKCFLLYGLAKNFNLPVSLCMVRAKYEGDAESHLPSLGQFDNAILVVDTDTGRIFLSPSSDCIPYGNLPENLQDVGGILLKEGKSEFINVPPQGEGEEKELKVELDGEDVIVTGKYKLSGNQAFDFRRLKNLNPTEMRNELEKWLTQMYPAARLIKYTISDLEDLDTPVSFSIHYRVKNYSLKGDKEFLVLRIPEVLYTAYEVGRETRKYPLRFKSRELNETRIEIEVPITYRIYYLPSPVNISSRIANYNAKCSTLSKSPSLWDKVFFKKGKRKILFEDRYNRKVTRAAIGDYPVYKNCREKMAKLSQERIVLIKE